jgi:hypothetical protein
MKLLPSFASKTTTGNGKKISRLRQNTPKKSLLRPTKKTSFPPTHPHVLARGNVETEAEIIKFGDGWERKYTNSKAGSALCCGWTSASKAQYKKLLKYIKRWSQQTQVRLKNGVTEATHAEYLQAKKKAQTGESILDGISLLDDDDNGEAGDDDDESVLLIEV